MNVDDLLMENIRTPLFTTHCYIPKKGSIQTIEFEDTKLPVDDKYRHQTYFYVSANPPYQYNIGTDRFAPDPTRFEPDSLLKALGLRYEVFQTDNISLLKDILWMAEEGILDNGKINVQPDMILYFCYKHGFPTRSPIHRIEDKGITAGVFLDEFIDEITDIYLCYAYWKALFIDIEPLYPPNTSKEDFQYLLQSLCRGHIDISINIEADKPSLIYHADSLFDLLMAQLAVLASKGAKYIDGGCVVHCADCGQPFIKYRKNSTLCEECKSGAAKQRRHRIKMKEEKKNG